MTRVERALQVSQFRQIPSKRICTSSSVPRPVVAAKSVSCLAISGVTWTSMRAV